MKFRKTLMLTAAVGTLAATACTDINTSTNNPRQRTTEGGGIGAIAGAIIGASRADSKKERRENIVKGAIVGGLVGGLIGNQLDKQASELQSAMGDNRIQIINNGDHLIVRMPQDILFAVDSSAVKPALRADLAALAGNLRRYPGSTVQITGHTDNTGTAAYNQDLSQRRADAVSAQLVNNGVSYGRIKARGAGEHHPIASNLTSEGRARNRRVDILIRPNN